VSSVLYPLIGGQSFLPDMGSPLKYRGEEICPKSGDAVVNRFGRVRKALRSSLVINQVYGRVLQTFIGLSELAGSIPAHRFFMPGDTESGDTIFDSEEKSEETKTGRQPLFSSPGDQIAGWMEQDREGNWYISCQVNFFGQSFNVPLFVNDDRSDARQYINKVGQALSE